MPGESFDLFLIEEKSLESRKERWTSAGGTFAVDHVPFGNDMIAAKHSEFLLGQQRVRIGRGMSKVLIQLRERKNFAIEILGSARPGRISVRSV